MGAALLMSTIMASFRILYDTDCMDLKKAVELVSLQLFDNSLPGDFATLFIGILEPATGKIDFVNAGHNPPLLLRQNGQMEKLEPGGTMIGAFDFVTWEADSVQLSEGDLLFIFTDGVTEADNGKEQFGDDRTEKYILQNRNSKPEETITKLMIDIETFMNEAPHSDDITMLALKRRAN